MHSSTTIRSDPAGAGSTAIGRVETRHNEAERRYEILVDGEIVGITEYRPIVDGVWRFPHTLIEFERRGQGLADRLVAHAMADVERRGIKVQPTCWYVDLWLDRHPEYDLRT